MIFFLFSPMNNIDHCRYFVSSMCWISLSIISSTAILKFSNSTTQLQMQLNFLNKKWISFLLRPATFNTLDLSEPDANPIIMSMKVFTMRPLLSNSFYYLSRAMNFGESKYTLLLLSVMLSCFSPNASITANGLLQVLL